MVWSVGVCAAKRVVENSPLAGENRDDEDGDDAVRSLQEAGGEVGVEVVAHVLFEQCCLQEHRLSSRMS